jgi:hypothetical protein
MEGQIDKFRGEGYRADKDFAWLGERLALKSLTSKECAKIVEIELAFDNSEVQTLL